MSTLTTNYLGLQLKNPIIAASSGLTNSLSNIIELEANGAAAVVVKSIFEEEIRLEAEDNFNKMTSQGFIYPETMEYFDYDEMGDPVFDYLKLISDAKAKEYFDKAVDRNDNDAVANTEELQKVAK